MTEDILLRVENLSKSYRIGHKTNRGQETFREMIWRSISRSLNGLARGNQMAFGQEFEEFWALKDISFEVRRGEVMGVVGRNGAGKSTLLKILSRITEPTLGRAIIGGRVASLLEVGTGFHPELTGRENVFLNGAILGMTCAEIKNKFDEIVDFAEVDRFLDTPVKRYSSGMYVRLAFAVAANLDPEILIIDEVLAVGDVVFQKKCMGKMKTVADSGRTVLFVSHNMQTISGLTERCILLENGTVAAIGPSRQVVQRYLGNQVNSDKVYRKQPAGTYPEFIYAGLRTSGPGPLQQHGAQMAVEMEIFTPEPIRNAAVSFQIFTEIHQPVLHLLNLDSELPMLRTAGIHRLTCTLPRLQLYPGNYYLTFYFGATDPRREFSAPREICRFEVVIIDGIREFYWAPNTAVYLDDSNWSSSKVFDNVTEPTSMDVGS